MSRNYFSSFGNMQKVFILNPGFVVKNNKFIKCCRNAKFPVIFSLERLADRTFRSRHRYQISEQFKRLF